MNKKDSSKKIKNEQDTKYAGIEKERLEEVRQQIPPEYVQRRAAQIWRRLLGDPKFQIEAPGEETYRGSFATALASMAAKNAEPDNDAYQIFEDRLTESLCEPFVLEAAASSGKERKWVRALTSMEVDYHPDEALSAAAAYANISKMRFPYKTRMYTHTSYSGSRPYVSAMIGYQSDAVHHYPAFMLDGKPQGWLLTKLQGPDIEGLLVHIETIYKIGHEGRVLGVGEIEWVG
jgi:hypothetical protein